MANTFASAQAEWVVRSMNSQCLPIHKILAFTQYVIIILAQQQIKFGKFHLTM